MKREILLTVTALASAATLATGANAADQPFQGKIGRTLAESSEWWPEPVKAPANAPNVVWILLDDVGFGASSAFGGGSPRRCWSSWPTRGCAIPISIPPRSARRPVPPC